VKTRDGRRITKVVDSLQLARKLEAKFKTQSLEDRFFNIKPSLTIGEVWSHYLRWAKGSKKSWRTDEFRWNKHVGHHLNVCPMDSVGPRAIVSIATAMKETGLSPASVKQVIVLIKRLYNWARQMDYYTGPNPAAKVPMPKLNNSRDAYLSREEISRLLATLDTYPNRCFSLLVKFALFTGLRRGELFKLRWVNVDLDFARVKLVDPKGGKDTILPLSVDAVAVLLDTEREARIDGASSSSRTRPAQSVGNPAHGRR
jgi:integrase